MSNQDQIHPREKSDRVVIDNLLNAQPNDYHLVELARLRIRYHNFPGAREIQKDLDRVLQQWQLTEAQLYAKTREIHENGQVYRRKIKDQDQQDWT
ncbi:hypothetical protein Sta7437_1370 [Stanieria cyanosphaera PCC 7437]|uniref:DUF3288 domain-containing protein n=1 Tax=Stanieria cyanosphaera (strain ATCC 29371 / PCC 7437) TaxID=111780 RepID=K9XTE4_STAC7|nr:DUF3288 family protein [Stanieria cyanosphaera]AFZ34937.1 hypothetical protein Sta7437_1370 [Stanieria cyanosphaera PCC 7437]